MDKPSRIMVSDRRLAARFFRALRLNHAEAWDWTGMMLVFISIGVGFAIPMNVSSLIVGNGGPPGFFGGILVIVSAAIMSRDDVKKRTPLAELVSRATRVDHILIAGFASGLATGTPIALAMAVWEMSGP